MSATMTKQTYEASPQRVLAAVEPKVLIPYDGSDSAETSVRESERMRTLEELVSKLRAGGSNVSMALKYGEAQEVLLEHAKEISADCIFIAADIAGSEFSNVAQSVVLGAPCSVEVVRPRTVTREHWKPAA